MSRAFGQFDGNRRTGSDLPGQVQGVLHQVVMRHDFSYQADPFRFPGVDGFASEEQLQCAVNPYGSWQQVGRSAVWGKPNIYPRSGKPGLVRGETDVAKQ